MVVYRPMENSQDPWKDTAEMAAASGAMFVGSIGLAILAIVMLVRATFYQLRGKTKCSSPQS